MKEYMIMMQKYYNSPTFNVLLPCFFVGSVTFCLIFPIVSVTLLVLHRFNSKTVLQYPVAGLDRLSCS